MYFKWHSNSWRKNCIACRSTTIRIWINSVPNFLLSFCFFSCGHCLIGSLCIFLFWSYRPHSLSSSSITHWAHTICHHHNNIMNNKKKLPSQTWKWVKSQSQPLIWMGNNKKKKNIVAEWIERDWKSLNFFLLFCVHKAEKDVCHWSEE